MANEAQSNEASVREFVISTSRKPFVRAGWANMDIIFAFIAAFMAHKVAEHFGSSYGVSLAVAAVFGSLLLTRYTRSISKIIVENSSIQFICAIHRERLDVANIKRIKVLELNLSSGIVIIVFLDRKILPRVFHYSRMIFPPGKDLHLTATNLRDFLDRTGVNGL